jgi:hypothetical protein
MKAKELYSNKENYRDEEEYRYNSRGEYGLFSISDYTPIIKSFGEVLIQVDDDDHEGDTRILYKSKDKYSYLIFGWGSCSGCDALQNCSTFEEIDELIERLRNNIKWFDTLEELQDYFRNKDWELEYSYYEEKTKEFIEKVLKYGKT